MKNAIVGLIVVALVILGWFLFVRNKVSKVANTTPQVTVAKSAFTSIKDALTKSLSLQCEYKDDTGRTTTSFIKNGAVRADVMAADPKKSGSVIIKDKKMYSWNGKEGIMMEFTDEQMKSAEKSMAQNKDVLDNMEKYKDRCKTATVSDSLFTPPTDVKFTDMSQMMKMMPSGSPSGAPTMNEDTVKQMMEKYQTPTTPDENQ